MDEIDSPRPTPHAVRRGRLAPALAGVIAVLTILFIAQLAAPVPPDQGDPAPETFTAVGDIVAASPSRTSEVVASPLPSTAGLVATSLASPSPVASPSLVADANHVATRVRVPELGIDLAVIAPPRDRRAYPKCGVAMYLADLYQPGEDGATYLYAHARAGMFLPIYQRAIQRLHGGPRSMLGMAVEVFTSDDLRYRYTIDEVRVHQVRLGDAARAKANEVWLQTSEGPKGTRGKTQVRARFVDVESASHRLAHPVAKPVTCG